MNVLQFFKQRLTTLLIFFVAEACVLLMLATCKSPNQDYLGNYIVELNVPTLEQQVSHLQNYDKKENRVKNFIIHQFPKIHPAYFTHFYFTAFMGFSARLTKTAAEEIKTLPYVIDLHEFKKEFDVWVPIPPGSAVNVNTHGQTNPLGETNIQEVGGSVEYKGKNMAWVLDSGIDFTHTDLNIDKQRSRSFVGYGNGTDDLGHGTHVAGVIASKGKYPGIAKGATVVAVKVLNKKGLGSTRQIIKGLDYIIHHAKPGDVVNMSLG